MRGSGGAKVIDAQLKKAIMEAYIPNPAGNYPKMDDIAQRYGIGNTSLYKILKDKRRDLGLSIKISRQKLTNKEANRFAKMVARGAKVNTLSKKFGISKNSVWMRKSRLEEVKTAKKFRENQKLLQENKRGTIFPGVKEGFISIRQ